MGGLESTQCLGVSPLFFPRGKSHSFLGVNVISLTAPRRFRKRGVHHQCALGPRAACWNRASDKQTDLPSTCLCSTPRDTRRFLDPTQSGNAAAAQTAVFSLSVLQTTSPEDCTFRGHFYRSLQTTSPSLLNSASQSRWNSRAGRGCQSLRRSSPVISSPVPWGWKGSCFLPPLKGEERGSPLSSLQQHSTLIVLNPSP